MKDPVFRQQLEEKRKELNAIVKERAPLEARMKELVKQHGNDLAALQKVPEWNDLHKKITSLNAKYEEVRKRQLVIAARKLNPAAGKLNPAAGKPNPAAGKQNPAKGDAPAAEKKEISK